MKHRYLADLHDPHDEPDSAPMDPRLFDFEDKNFSKQELGGQCAARLARQRAR